MSNTPPAPDKKAPAPVAEKPAKDGAASTGLSGKTIGIGVGVGSAAIVAALLFTKPWKR